MLINTDQIAALWNKFMKDVGGKLMIYRVTHTINNSIQGYFEESKVSFTVGLASERSIEVPTGAALLRN